MAEYVCETDQSPNDPRVQRLLHDAQKLKEKHEAMMQSSPLRLRDNSADRMGIQRSTSIREAASRAKLISYAHLNGSL